MRWWVCRLQCVWCTWLSFFFFTAVLYVYSTFIVPGDQSCMFLKISMNFLRLKVYFSPCLVISLWWLYAKPKTTLGKQSRYTGISFMLFCQCSRQSSLVLDGWTWREYLKPDWPPVLTACWQSCSVCCSSVGVTVSQIATKFFLLTSKVKTPLGHFLLRVNKNILFFFYGALHFLISALKAFPWCCALWSATQRWMN